ncbi:MAG TPA: hypothetical protein P5567_10400 [Kiritimatiellia bacterium]|nr:hypothetical protein [Kiritimatiellia bacterium]HRZ12849.1 hypothetical protein [Kiritimatiellia bacterium]HSA18199.1 hypothetical protein [Kiritimatiellia bacterium]
MSAVAPFYWSPERYATFHACLRRYYYRYYAEAPAFRPARDLRPRTAWADEWLRRGAHEFLRGGLDEEAAAARLLQVLRDDFKASRQHGYRAQPKTTDGLFEHEYAISVPDAEWKDLADRAVADLRAFCRTDYARALAAVPAAARLAVGEFLRFDLLGLPVDIRPDFAARTTNGVALHAWGPPGDGARPLARAALAWLAVGLWKAAPESVEVVEYDFPAGPSAAHRFTAEDLEAARELVHDAAYETRYPLADPDRNAAREQDFDFTDDEATCRACPFLKLCARWR